jgi:hypothetical protein
MDELEIKIRERELELKEIEQRERLQFEREQSTREFEMREKELRHKRWDVIAPVVVAIVGALLGIWANTNANGKKNEELQRKRAEAENALQNQKARSDLVLELIKTGNPIAARQNIKAFLELGLLDDPDGKIANYLSRTEKSVPNLSGGETDPKGTGNTMREGRKSPKTKYRKLGGGWPILSPLCEGWEASSVLSFLCVSTDVAVLRALEKIAESLFTPRASMAAR